MASLISSCRFTCVTSYSLQTGWPVNFAVHPKLLFVFFIALSPTCLDSDRVVSEMVKVSCKDILGSLSLLLDARYVAMSLN